MPWAKGVLLFTMAVMSLCSSLWADPEAFFEAGSAYGAVSEKTIRFGKVLIGGQGSVSYNVKTSVLRSAESKGHQANEEAWFQPANAKLRRLGSSVQCSNDSMILRIPGQRMPHFLVDRGEESPMPLSEMPASCGFSLKRARRDVSLVTPYRGCHVRQKVSVHDKGWKLYSAAYYNGISSASVLPIDGSWEPLLLKYTQCSFTLETTAGSLVVTAPFTGSCWEMTNTERRLPLTYGDQEVTLSCPLTLPTIAPTVAPTTPVRDPTDMQQMFDRFPFERPWWYPYSGVPATLPPTVPPTTTTPFHYPFQQPMFPPKYPMPIFDPFYSKGDPAAPPAPQHPWYPNFPPYMSGFQSQVEVTTPATTTTTPAPYQPEHQYPGYPMYPPFYGQRPIKSLVSPTVKYPFMPQYPKEPVFGPRSPRSVYSSALWSRR
ncbi:hypothetical protein cypCar_00030587 [Cyprinus carpio]|nr:hypothetical protein cypCar_00030587 [Cyprinus carpio]